MPRSAVTLDERQTPVNDAFERWWEANGTGGPTEHDLARQAWEAATLRAARIRAPKPRELPRGALLGEQQHCYEKGWRAGVVAFRKAVAAR